MQFFSGKKWNGVGVCEFSVFSKDVVYFWIIHAYVCVWKEKNDVWTASERFVPGKRCGAGLWTVAIDVLCARCASRLWLSLRSFVPVPRTNLVRNFQLCMFILNYCCLIEYFTWDFVIFGFSGGKGESNFNRAVLWWLVAFCHFREEKRAGG